ncbi:MAG: uroporphyrinogen-III synthase [Ginsengibacter sp.]
MGVSNVNILSTRPIGKTLIDEAASHGIIIDEISFIETVEKIDSGTTKKIKELSNKNITAVFTSMNAVTAIGEHVAANVPWKIFCIGNTTKDLLVHIFGEKNIEETADNALELAEKIVAANIVSKVYFFCGDLRRDELPEKLKANGIEVEEIMVYNTVFTSQRISKNYDGILFFSPSAVESFFIKNDAGSNTRFFAIGKTTAESVKAFTDQPVITAASPGKKKLVEEAIRYFCRRI